MNDNIDLTWTDLERTLSARLRESVDDLRLPPGFSARLAPAFAARRRVCRRRKFAAAALVAAFAATIAALAFSMHGPSGPTGRISGILAENHGDGPVTELAGSWTLAGLCRTLRRRRRNEENDIADITPDQSNDNQ